MTPLQCVVLSAYALLSPTTHPSRQVIEQATRHRALTPTAKRVAVTLAEHAGLMERGRLTEFGRMAAKAHLKRLNGQGSGA
ncbi:hypothetical protein [Deinococcus fonticola]|uniref:hypothetical protein n=1 Tax=Deinococcus fonticola TaxID=2528713 RepID=UPI00107559BA|nr:hypothetical protein [Deinococcus fonticola]